MPRIIVLVSLFSLLAGSAVALGQPVTLGVRAGHTAWDDFKQMHMGGHAVVTEILPNIDYTPSFEFGFGDDLTLLALNNDVTYRFSELTIDPWGLYAGGSFSLQYLDNDIVGSDTEIGLNAVVGATFLRGNGNTILAEARFGIMDTPDFKLTFGYTFS